MSGCPGTGKTALILQLVEYSCFGRKRNYEYEELREQSDIREMLPEELTAGMFTHLASHVVAYHFCQVSYYRQHIFLLNIGWISLKGT